MLFTIFGLWKILQREIVSCQHRGNPSGSSLEPWQDLPHPSTSKPALLPTSHLLLPLPPPPTYLHWRQNQRWCQRVGCGLQTGSWWLSFADHWRLVKYSAELDTHRTSQLGWPRQRGDVNWQCASQLQRKPKAIVRPLFLAEPSLLLALYSRQSALAS